MFYQPQINLFAELENINRENKLKKKLENDIKLTHMSLFDENRKVQRLKVFNQIQLYIRRNELNELQDYLKKEGHIHENTFERNFDGKKKHKGSNISNSEGLLENTKDRLHFLNKIVTSQAHGYNPVKNFMQKFRAQSKIIQERRNHERDIRIKFLKNKDNKKQKSQLAETADRLNKARVAREKARIQRLEREKKKVQKKKVESKKNQGPVGTSEVVINQIIENTKTHQELRIENINFKDGKINSNRDVLSNGFYELPEYNKAMIFKFTMNFENAVKDKVVDLVDNVGDLLLHINIRKDHDLIVLNSQIKDKWGKEIKIKRKIYKEQIVKILIKGDYYKVLINEEIISFFIQRKKSKVNYININDDIKDFLFKVM
jgi:hypothetical protein